MTFCFELFLYLLKIFDRRMHTTRNNHIKINMKVRESKASFVFELPFPENKMLEFGTSS